MVRKLLLILFVVPIIISCEGSKESLPAYINIETIDFDHNHVGTIGNGGTSITDVWIYDNSNLLGVFKLPATVAVSAEGNHDISISAGIKLNGISSTREAYPFYESWKSTITLSPLDTVFTTPTVSYFAETGISFKEEFEDVVLGIDTGSSSDVALVRTLISNEPAYIDKYIGIATINATNPGFKAFTKSLFMVPTSSPLPIYLELDYRCNQEFVVSSLLKDAGAGTTETPIISLRSTVKNGEMEWKHIYIDLTDYFAGQVNAVGFGFSFTAYYNSGNNEGIIHLDNAKVVNTK